MIEHDVSPDERGDHFSMGRPVREVIGALQKITGSELGSRELFHVTRQGSATQQWLQRKLYVEHAKRWENWWKENWRRFLMNPAYSLARIEPFREPRPEVDTEENEPFPVGEDVVVAGGLFNLTMNPISEEAYGCLLDLDTLRIGGYPHDFFPRELDAESVYEKIEEDPQAFERWCANQGFELYVHTIQAEEADELSFVLVPKGVRLWRIENERFRTLDDELAESGKIDRGPPLAEEEWLVDRDPETGRYQVDQPATFLFATSEGTTGVIQVVGQVNRGLPDGTVRRGVLLKFQYIFRQVADVDD